MSSLTNKHTHHLIGEFNSVGKGGLEWENGGPIGPLKRKRNRAKMVS